MDPRGKEICIFGKSRLADGCYFWNQKIASSQQMFDRLPQNRHDDKLASLTIWPVVAITIQILKIICVHLQISWWSIKLFGCDSHLSILTMAAVRHLNFLKSQFLSTWPVGLSGLICAVMPNFRVSGDPVTRVGPAGAGPQQKSSGPRQK